MTVNFVQESISSTTDDTTDCICDWFVDSGEAKRGTFPFTSLEMVEKEENW